MHLRLMVPLDRTGTATLLILGETTMEYHLSLPFLLAVAIRVSELLRSEATLTPRAALHPLPTMICIKHN